MKNGLTFIFTLLTVSVLGQSNPTEEAQPIVIEGKLLYKSEMASWYGTDLFLENYKERENIGGYFSYTEKGLAKCIFFSKSDIMLTKARSDYSSIVISYIYFYNIPGRLS